MSSASGSTSRIERFGPFWFDLDRSTLYRGNEPVILARKRLEVLQLLAEHAGTIVRKEEIIERVWPNQHIDENNLTLQIFNLRRDLEDDPKRPTYIITAPGIGYLLRTDKIVPPPPAETGSASSNPSESNGDESPRLPGVARFRTRLLVGAIAVFCLGIGLLIGYISWNANRPTVAKISSFTSLPGLEGEPAFSPDGSMLVFSSEGEGGSNRDLYLKRRDGEEPIRLTTHPEMDTQPVWSPDGRQIAFLRRNQDNWALATLVVLTYPAGSDGTADEKEIAAAGEGLDWSPDGKYFVTGDVPEMDAKSAAQTDSSRGLCLISVDGSEKRVITSRLAGEVIQDFNPRFSPDGRWIAFLRSRDRETSLADLFVLDREKEGAPDATRQLTFDRRRITDLRWMPDGRSLIIASDRDEQRRLWQIPVSNGKPAGKPRIVTTIEAKVENFVLTRNGEVLAFTEQLEDTTIEIRRLGGLADGYPCLINSSSTEDSPRFSPDGKRLVFCSGRTGRNELWIARSDCTGLAMLNTFQGPGGTGSPRWSPDGETIAFDRRDGNLINVFTLHLPGISNGTKPQGLGIDDHSNLMPAWSHDGRQIYFQSSRNGEQQIWRQELASGRQSQVTTVGGNEAIESTDGETLFFTRKDYLWRRDQKNGVEKPIVELENFPVRRYWGIVGRGIYFVPRTSDIRPFVYRFDLQTQRIEKVMEVGGFPARTVPGLSVTADEKLLAISYISYSMGDIKLATGWKKF